MENPQIRIECTRTIDPQLSSSNSSSPSCVSDCEDLPPFWRNLETKKRSLSRQLSMYEAPRNIAWERRRRQFLHQERRKNEDDLTDEDLKELKGCIELGFGFNGEDGQRLCTTIPALDLYFAVNRQFWMSPLPSPSGGGAGAATQLGRPVAIPSPTPALSPGLCFLERPPMSDSDSRKILSPGNDPQQMKTKLRHWAQAVACSVMQSPIKTGGID